MKLYENYNNARQKYGTELVETLTQSGLPPQFLLSACRFITENGVPQQRIVNLFKEWMRYVAKFNNTDVNKLSYEQFFNLISQEKSKHCVPEDLRTNGNIENSDHQIYQNKLPKEITSYLYNIAANQTEELENNKQNINCNRNMNKNRIRLTESQLRQIIKESVDQMCVKTLF